MVGPRRFRIAREGLYYTALFLAVLIGATSRQLNLLMLIGCLMAGPLLLSLLYGRWALRALKIERQLPPHLHAGERLRVEVAVTNERMLSQWSLRVEDSVARAIDADHRGEQATVGVFFPCIPSRATRQCSYEGELPRRGRYQFGPLRATTRFPLGLVQHELVLSGSEHLLVHPKLGRLNPNWVKMIREHESGSQRMTRRGLLEDDFYGLREWRPGDSRRWIHWRTSARRGSVVVRQFEQRRSQNLAILLDLWQPARPTELEIERVETAISFVATLLTEACRRPGAQLHLEIAAREPLRTSGAGSPVFLREQMDALALAMPHHEVSMPPELGHSLALISAATPTFVVTTRPVDWEALGKAASERESQLDSRSLLEVNVAAPDFSRYYQPVAPSPAEPVTHSEQDP